jgi:surface antigen
MTRCKKIAPVFALCAALSACAMPGQPGYGAPGEIGMNKTTGGALLGAGAGGLLGSQFGSGAGKGIATLVGVLAGGLIGSQAGTSLDRADQAAVQRATTTALDSGAPGRPVPWRNPDTGHTGTVTPQATYQTASGQTCREFQQTITVGGQTQQGYGKACRQADGSWQIVQ